MEYSLVYTARAQKDIKKFDSVLKAKIGKAMLKLKQYPFANTKKMVNFEIGQFRYRAGDYRIIFDINGLNIVVLRIGHRRDIYK